MDQSSFVCTQLNALDYRYLTLIILLNIIHLFCTQLNGLQAWVIERPLILFKHYSFVLQHSLNGCKHCYRTPLILLNIIHLFCTQLNGLQGIVIERQ